MGEGLALSLFRPLVKHSKVFLRRVHRIALKRLLPTHRYCTEGKRTFSSRLILEKHIQVRHGIKVTDENRSQEVLITRLGARNSQVGGQEVEGSCLGCWILKVESKTQE